MIKNILMALALPFWFLSRFIPRDPKFWVFGASDAKRFADNPKHLFLYLRAKRPDIRCVWLTDSLKTRDQVRSLGHESHLNRSFLGIWACLKAKAAIVSHSHYDVNHYFLNGALLFQLWHGMPIKHIGDMFLKPSFKTRIFRKFWFPKKWDYMFATSQVFREIFKKAMPWVGSVEICGSPRFDIMGSAEEEPLLGKLRQHYGEKTGFLLYAPTFRDRYNSYYEMGKNATKKQDLLGDYGFKAETFDAFLEAENMLMLVKGHYTEEKMSAQNSKRVIFIDDSDISDTNLLLKGCDMLLTDYSSILFDFLLLDKPVIHAPFDWEEYTETRKLYFEFNELVAGPVARNWTEVQKAVSQLKKSDVYEWQRITLSRKFNAAPGFSNCEKITGFISNKTFGL